MSVARSGRQKFGAAGPWQSGGAGGRGSRRPGKELDPIPRAVRICGRVVSGGESPLGSEVPGLAGGEWVSGGEPPSLQPFETHGTPRRLPLPQSKVLTLVLREAVQTSATL